jgi:hypothetical protein
MTKEDKEKTIAKLESDYLFALRKKKYKQADTILRHLKELRESDVWPYGEKERGVTPNPADRKDDENRPPYRA